MPHKDLAVRAQYLREYKRRNRFRYAPRQKVYDAAKHANQRAALYGAPGTITPEEAAIVLGRGRCHYCGSTDDLTLDHVAPLHEGGVNRPENIVCACRPCNISKFRSDRPGRWSRLHDACVGCGTTERKHLAKGRCTPCYYGLA